MGQHHVFAGRFLFSPVVFPAVVFRGFFTMLVHGHNLVISVLSSSFFLKEVTVKSGTVTKIERLRGLVVTMLTDPPPTDHDRGIMK